MRLTAEQRDMLALVQADMDRAKALMPNHDGFVCLPGLAREIICDAKMRELLPLKVVEIKRPPYPMLTDTLWNVTDAGRAALAHHSPEGERSGGWDGDPA